MAPAHLMRGSGRVTVGWLVVVLALVLSLAHARNGPGSPDDEGLLLVYPEQVQNGAVPHRDYESFYGPGNDYAIAAAFQLMGPRVGVERAIGLAYRLLIVSALFALAAFDGALIGLVGGLLAAAIFAYWDFTWAAYAWLGGLALALCGLWAHLHAARASAHRPLWLATAGALAGGAVLFRFDLLPAAALSALPLLWRAPREQRRWFMLGLLLPALGLAAHLVRAGVGPVVMNVVVDAILRSGSQSGLPLPPAWSTEGWYFVLMLGSSLIMLLSALVARLGECGPDVRRRLLALALFELALVPAALQRPDGPHFMYVGIVTVGLLPVAIAWLIKSIPGRASPRAGIAGVAVAVLAACTLEVDARRILDTPSQSSVWVSHRGRLFPVYSAAQAAAINSLLVGVERRIRAGERLFVGPANLRRTIYNDIYLYHLLPQLKPATYHLDMNPGTANRSGGRLAEDVASADVLVLTTEYDTSRVWRAIMPDSRLGSDAAIKIVASEFKLLESHGPFRLYLRARARSQANASAGRTVNSRDSSHAPGGRARPALSPASTSRSRRRPSPGL